MGRKIRGAALRAKKRADEAQEELVEQTAHRVETQHVVGKPNEELFVLDTTAKPLPKGALPVTKKGKSRGKQHEGLQEKKERQIRALLAKHGNDAKKLAKLAADTKPRRKRPAAAFDIWGNGEDEQEKNQGIVSKTNTLPDCGIGSSLAGTAPAFTETKALAVTRQLKEPSVAIEVAHSGQSYHPDPQKHQDMIGEALSLELRRKEAEKYKLAPVSNGMNPETRALLVRDDEESSSNDEESDNDADEVVVAKKIQKLTRAQRNKQKRVRAEERSVRERKQMKKAMNAVQEVKSMKKELKRQEEERKERKEWIAQAKDQDRRTLGKQVFQQRSKLDPMGAPTLPVALTEDLQNSSLRTLKPKGSLITDRMESFMDRKMAQSKRLDRKRVVQGNKRRRMKVKAKGHDIQVTDESGRDYLLMG